MSAQVSPYLLQEHAARTVLRIGAQLSLEPRLGLAQQRSQVRPQRVGARGASDPEQLACLPDRVEEGLDPGERAAVVGMRRGRAGANLGRVLLVQLIPGAGSWRSDLLAHFGGSWLPGGAGRGGSVMSLGESP